MPPPGTPLSNIYKLLSSQGIKNFPATEQEFTSKLQADPNLQTNIYTHLSGQNIKNFPGTQKEFITMLFPQKKSLHEGAVPTGSEGSPVTSTPDGGYVGASPEQKDRLKSTYGNVTSPFAPELSSLPQNHNSKSEEELKQSLIENDNGVNRVASGISKFDQSFISAFTGIPKSIAIASHALLGGGKPEDDMVYKMAEWVDKKAAEEFPTNPKYKDDVLPEVAGTLMAFWLGGAAGRTSKVAELGLPAASKATLQEIAKHLPAAFMASAGTASAEYENALASGADQATAYRTFEENLVNGVPFLISPTFKAFGKFAGGSKVLKGLAEGSKGGIVGSFQMGSSQALENLSAEQTYDKTREITEGVLNAGGSGFAINGFLTGIMAALAHKRLVMKDPKIDQAWGYVKAKQKVLQDQNIKNTDFYKQGTQTIEMELQGNMWVQKGDLGKNPAETTTKTSITEGNVVDSQQNKTVNSVVEPKSGLWYRGEDKTNEGQPKGQPLPGETKRTADISGGEKSVVDPAVSKTSEPKGGAPAFDKGVGSNKSLIEPDKSLINNTGSTQEFFSDVVTGKSDKYKPGKPYEAIMPFTPKQDEFNKAYSKFKGNFDEHIATSIPAFRDVQVKKGQAIVDMLPNGGTMIDIAGSEGGFNKAITQVSGGKIKTKSLEVNPDMRAAHEATPVEGADFINQPFGGDYEGLQKFTPETKVDVVHESMGFQFMSPDRAGQIAEAKKFLKPNGVMIVEQKVGNEQWDANELSKDNFKSKYYTPEQIAQKNAEIKVSNFDSNEGMAGNMVTEDILFNELEKNFKYVQQYWDAGNFKGYIASNDRTRIGAFMKSVGSTASKFSNRSDADLRTNISKTEVSELKPAKVNSQELVNVSDKYKAANNVDTPIANIDQVFKQSDIDQIAKMHEDAADGSKDPVVIASYRAFMNETMAQYKALVEAGYKIEPYVGEGEPYGVDSSKVRKDLNDNKHLSYLMSESAIGDNPATTLGNDYILLEDTGLNLGGRPTPYNDLFRAVHDIMGHGVYNNSFSTQGEFKAYLTHSNVYSEAAQQALFLETVAYNAYYAKNNQFAPRKLYVVPQELISRLRGVETPVIKSAEITELDRKNTQNVTDTEGLEQKNTLELNKTQELSLDKDSRIGEEVDFLHAGGERRGTITSFEDGKYKILGKNKIKYTVTADKFIVDEAPEVTGDIVKINKALDDAADKFKTRATRGGIVPISINPFVILKDAFGLFNKAQELTFGKAFRGLEEAIAKQVNIGLASRYSAVRTATQTLRNLIGGLPYSEQDLKNKLNFSGNKNHAHIRGKDLAEQWYKIVDTDFQALERVHAVLDPVTYAKDPILNKLKYNQLTPAEKALYDGLRAANDFIHEWSHKRGFISNQTYKDRMGTYSGKFYEEYEMPDDLKENMKTTRADFTMYNQRKNGVSIDVLKDPVYGTAKRMTQIMQSQAIFDYADDIIKHGKIKVEDTEFPGSIQLGKPGDKPFYGTLTGKYVPQYIAEDFKGFFYTNSMMQSAFDAFKVYDRLWIRQFLKKSHTVFDPVVQLGNATANFSFAFWTGVDPATFGVNLITAGKEIKSKGPRFNEAVKLGLIGSDIMSGDLIPEQFNDGKGTAERWLENKVSKRVAPLGRIYDKFSDVASKAYSGTDDVSKLSAYISLRNAGYSQADAGQKVYEGFQNYATVGKSYDFASKTPIIGNPYIKFKADLGRIMKNAVTRRPLTSALYLGMLYYIKELLSADAGEDEDTKAVRENRRFIPKIWTPLGNLPMVWQTRFGEINFARFVSPYYVYDTGKTTSLGATSDWLPYQSDWEPSKASKDVQTTWLEMPDVLLGVVAQIVWDKDFRGKSIADPKGNKFGTVAVEPGEQWMNRMNYVSRSTIPFYRNVDDMLHAWNGEPDTYDRVRTVEQSILNNFIKVQQFGSEEAKSYLTREVKYKMQQWQAAKDDISVLKKAYQKEALNIKDEAGKRKSMEKYLRRKAIKVDQMLQIQKDLENPRELLKKFNEKSK